MSKIALVAVAMIVNGERQVFQPGEKLPALPKHDEQELLKAGSIQDESQAAKDAKALEKELAEGDQAFQEARAAVQDAAVSTLVDASSVGDRGGNPPPPPPPPAPPAPAAKAATAKAKR